MAVDTLGHLLALHVTPANEQERVQVLCEAVQQVMGETVKLAWADQGYMGDKAHSDEGHGVQLEIVRLPEAKKGFVLLPRCWVGCTFWCLWCRCCPRRAGYWLLPNVHNTL